MELITAGSSGSRAMEELTMDKLWSEAESLGCVEIKKSSWTDNAEYTAEITFRRKSGTRIHAVGTNTDARFALGDAINEAREMGAGIAQ